MSVVSGWVTRCNERHAVQVSAGMHDQSCEYRSTGHYLCNCSSRKRIENGFTEPPGPLIIQYPMCPRCYSEVWHNGDGFECPKCPVSWSHADESDEGYFTDNHGSLDMVTWDAKRAASTVTK